MKALHDLVQSGKVRYIGASSMRCWQFGQFKPVLTFGFLGTYDVIAMMQEVAEKNGWTKFVSMQPEYSLIYREEVRASVAVLPT
jgi:aryl-alcohol dehydrogenase-like predicted oxidoreductase